MPLAARKRKPWQPLRFSAALAPHTEDQRASRLQLAAGCLATSHHQCRLLVWPGSEGFTAAAAAAAAAVRLPAAAEQHGALLMQLAVYASKVAAAAATTAAAAAGAAGGKQVETPQCTLGSSRSSRIKHENPVSSSNGRSSSEGGRRHTTPAAAAEAAAAAACGACAWVQLGCIDSAALPPLRQRALLLIKEMNFLAAHVGRRVVLPLATGATRLVSFELEAPEAALEEVPGGPLPGGPPYLCCWQDEEATEPKFYIPLKGCRIVNNITELGPCLYFVASTGEFEFQCSSRQVCARWVETFKGLGVSLLKFTDLYKLTGFIGEGSFAKVYMGKHLFTGEEVVIKAVDKKKVLESNVYTEIEVLRKVSHPYIMRLYAAYEQEDFVCLVLEYLRGGELFDYLSEKGPFSEDQARHAMRRILLALQAMHMKGIVHRDLKTENLIIEHPSNPASIKIIDFGLAATVGSQEMKMRCGSPGYVAPEILQDMPYGPKVDVFSSGVILYTLLAGFPPFRGQNVKDILKKNLRCQISFNHQRWANIPHSVKDLIGWMCCKQPAKRCAAVQALTHPWFQRIARPLPKAAALSTMAAEESDRKATLQYLEQTRGHREPLGLKAGGEMLEADLEPIDEKMQGLGLRSKDTEAARQSRGPSFFNSAPPGAAAAANGTSEREKHYTAQNTESQGKLKDAGSKQSAQNATAFVKTVESPEAAAAKAAAKAQATAEAKAAAEAAVREITAARQPQWAAQDHEEETGGPKTCPSAAPEKLNSASHDGNIAAAVAAAAAAAAADIFGAATEWVRTQQHPGQGPCYHAVSPLAHEALGSAVALLASRAPLPVEASERISSFGSQAPPQPPTADSETPNWGHGSATPTDPKTQGKREEEAVLLRHAAAAPAGPAAAAPARGSRRQQWLEEPPPSPDSGGSTQASPTAAFRYCHMAELSPAANPDCPTHLGASSSGGPLADAFEGPSESTSGTPSGGVRGLSLKLLANSFSAQQAMAGACLEASSGRGPDGACCQETAGFDPCGDSHMMPSLSCSREGWQSGEVQKNALLGKAEDGAHAAETQVFEKQQLFIAEFRADAMQGELSRLKRRVTPRPPRHSREPLEGGDRPERLDCSSDAAEHSGRQHCERPVAANPARKELPCGGPLCGCLHTEAQSPLARPAREDRPGRGRLVFALEDQQLPGFPSLVLPTMIQKQEPSYKKGGGPHGQTAAPHAAPPRTVKLHPYKQLHSHHYLVGGANEVIRSGSVPSGKNYVRSTCISAAARGGESGGRFQQRPPEAGSRRREAPRDAAGEAAGGWGPLTRSGEVCCPRQEGHKSGRPASINTPHGASSGAEEASPLCRNPPMLGADGGQYERPPSRSSSSSSSSSSPCSNCHGRRSNGSCSRGSRQQHQPLHALQSRLFEFMGLPVLSKMASALGARDWLRYKGRSHTSPIQPSPAAESPDLGPSARALKNGRDSRDGRSRNRDSGKREPQRLFEEV
ncbi:hypothetical protein Efla_004345 [Eimeria flavescens]